MSATWILDARGGEAIALFNAIASSPFVKHELFNTETWKLPDASLESVLRVHSAIKSGSALHVILWMDMLRVHLRGTMELWFVYDEETVWALHEYGWILARPEDTDSILRTDFFVRQS